MYPRPEADDAEPGAVAAGVVPDGHDHGLAERGHGPLAQPVSPPPEVAGGLDEEIVGGRRYPQRIAGLDFLEGVGHTLIP